MRFDFTDKSREWLARRNAAVMTEMRSLLDAADAAGGDLPPDAKTRFDLLDAEAAAISAEATARNCSLRLTTHDPLAVRGGADVWTAQRSQPLSNRSIDRAVEEVVCPSSFNRAAGGSGFTYRVNGEERCALLGNESMFRATTGRDLPPPHERFSLGRYLQGAITRDWTNAEIEQRVHSTLVGSQGGLLLQGSVASFILDTPRAMSTYARLAQTVPMPAQTLLIPRQSGDITPAWRVETGTITASDATFEGVTLMARSLAALFRVSREAMRDIPGLAAQLEVSAARAMANELDRACYLGVGIPGGEPGGLFNDTAITTSDHGGIALTIDTLVNMYYEVVAQNFTPTAFVWSNTTGKQLALVKDSAGAYQFGTGNMPEPLRRGVSFNETTQLTSQAVCGDFSQAVLGIRDELEVEIFTSGTAGGVDALETNSVWVRLVMRADCALMRSTAFAARTNILT